MPDKSFSDEEVPRPAVRMAKYDPKKFAQLDDEHASRLKDTPVENIENLIIIIEREH